MGRAMAEDTSAIGGARIVTDRLLKVHEVAEMLGLAKGTIYHHISAGKLPCIRLSARCVRFQESAIKQFIEKLAADQSPAARKNR
jgi:excisionase family DNA binding protein